MYDIASQIVADLGGAAALSETRISLIRRFASLAALSEEQEVRIANGEEVDIASFSQMASTLVRLSARIGLKRIAAKDITPTLAEVLRAEKHEREERA
jgi:hypothetical protein